MMAMLPGNLPTYFTKLYVSSIEIFYFRWFFHPKNRERVISLFIKGVDGKKSVITNKQKKVLPTLLQNVSVILRLLNSDEDINVDAFEDLLKETNLILIDHFSFMSISPTVHAVLGHGADLVRNNHKRGLLDKSEEASEASHKILKWLREHGARNTSLEDNLKDCFRKLWFMSDPIIRNTKRKIRCSKCDKTGHTIRSCPEIRDSEKSEDDYLFDSLIFHDNDPFDYEAEDWGDDLEDIWEDEKGDNEMEVVDDDDFSYLD